ncbi:hypothetical protein HDU91_005787, partial [Kappamyces sp. JEL0680]
MSSINKSHLRGTPRNDFIAPRRLKVFTPTAEEEEDATPVDRNNMQEDMGETPTAETAVQEAPPLTDVESPSFGDLLVSGRNSGTIPSRVKVLLHTLPFFSGLSESDDFIDEISKTLKFRKCQVGDVIIRQGEAARAMFFVIKGTLKVISEDGEIDLAELTSGSYCKHRGRLMVVGEIGILFDVTRTATVVAKTPCTLLSLTSERVSQELAVHPEIAKRVRDNAQERLLSLAKEYERNGKSVSSDIRRQIQEFGVAIDIPVPLSKDTRTHTYENMREIVPIVTEDSCDSDYEDDDDEDYSSSLPIINIVPLQDCPKPSTSASILSKKLTEKRRASVAVWSDDKLMQFANKVTSQSAAKESRLAALSNASMLSIESS